MKEETCIHASMNDSDEKHCVATAVTTMDLNEVRHHMRKQR